jgi:diacylglycerol kinase (ATP)
MSYYEVDRSEEALQEDEELIEAVEKIVTKGAEAIITDVKNDVSGVYERIKSFLDRFFPFLEYWRADHALFWIDMEHLALASVLFVVLFLFISPWQNSKHHGDLTEKKHGLRRKTSSYDRLMQFRISDLNIFKNRNGGPSQLSSLERSKSTSSILHAALTSDSNVSMNGSNLRSRRDLDETEDEESEEEKFAKRWEAIEETPYKYLVLPPQCKRVDKPRKQTRTPRLSSSGHHDTTDIADATASTGPKIKRGSSKQNKKDNTDENPWNRLVNYVVHLCHLIMLFRKYDYAGAGWTLINWMRAALRARSRQGGPAAAEEDDEDEHSVASSTLNSCSIDHEDGGRRIASPKTQVDGVASKEKKIGGSTTPITGNRSKVSPRTIRSKKEKTGRVTDAPAMPCFTADHDSRTQEIAIALSETGDISSDAQLVEESDPKIFAGDDTCSATSKETSKFSASGDKDDPSSRSQDGIMVEREEKEANSSSDNTKLIMTPPYRPQVYGTDNTPYHTPMRESHLPILDLQPNLSASASSHTPSKACLVSLNSHNKTSSVTSGVKTRDALESYRTTSTWSRLGHFNANFSESTHPHQSLSSPKRPSIDRQESVGSKSYYFETADTNEKLRKMVVDVPTPDKNGYIVGDEFLPDSNFTPLLVFVNSRSGPQQGHLLITQIRGLLNPIQVWDLADGSPEEILESFSVFTRLRILVCGGDGTVSWVVSTIEKIKLERWPPIAILPLGTGNDLARIHGWGGGYNNESLIKILDEVSESYISWLDRWEMTIENKKGKVKQTKSFFNYLGVGADAQAALQVHMLRESRPQLFFSRLVNKAWYGVFGAEDIIKATSINLPHDITLIADGVEIPLPADSQGIILLNIDSYSGGVPLWSSGHKGPLRGRRSDGLPPMKRSKSLDALRSLKKTKKPTSPLVADVQQRTLPTPLPARKFDRIDSVEDIASLALTEEEKYTRVTACDNPSSCQDGLLDIVSIRGAFHLGQIRVGLSTAQKLCQCREATIIIRRKVSVQIDGEPWRQNACVLRVRRKKPSAIMLHRSAEESNGVETEVAKVLDWAEESRLIDNRVHAAIMKEFSRRIESKTRERRHKENLMFSLKRAIKSGSSISNSEESLSRAKGGALNPAGIMF